MYKNNICTMYKCVNTKQMQKTVKSYMYEYLLSYNTNY